MPYDPSKHNRRSIRLSGYDYSQAGKYFVTICCQKRACLFGHIENGIMHHNPAGKMVSGWYYELENKFPDIKCREMIVMPNHFHAIIENTGMGAVGADLCVRPYDTHTQTDHFGLEGNAPDKQDDSNGRGGGRGEHAGSPLPPPPQGSSLSHVIQWFKTMTTNEYIRGVKNLDWQRFDGKLWQRNYWEHIIRSEQAYYRIARYIEENPRRWAEDKFFGENHTSG